VFYGMKTVGCRTHSDIHMCCNWIQNTACVHYCMGKTHFLELVSGRSVVVRGMNRVVE